MGFLLYMGYFSEAEYRRLLPLSMIKETIEQLRVLLDCVCLMPIFDIVTSDRMLSLGVQRALS